MSRKPAFPTIALGLMLSACGSHTSQSGADSDMTTAGLAGIYEGNESITLSQSNTNTNSVQDKIENRVTITVNEEGLLHFSASNGGSGTAQIRNDRKFRMRSNAATQFDGQCQTGTIFLDGQVNTIQISGNYRSESLVCNGLAYHISGSLSARRK